MPHLFLQDIFAGVTLGCVLTQLRFPISIKKQIDSNISVCVFLIYTIKCECLAACWFVCLFVLYGWPYHFTLEVQILHGGSSFGHGAGHENRGWAKCLTGQVTRTQVPGGKITYPKLVDPKTRVHIGKSGNFALLLKKYCY